MPRLAYGGTGAPEGTNASCTTRSTFARRPSSIGASPRARGGTARPVPACARSRTRSPRGSRAGTRCGGRGTAPRRLALGVAVRERLERLRTLVARLADRREEQRLLDPLGPLSGQIRAGDEHGVVRRQAPPAGRRHGGTSRRARTASTRAPSRRRRSRSSPTRPTPPRRARSSAPWRRSCCHATATTRSSRHTDGAVAIVPRVRPATREPGTVSPSGGGPMSSTTTSTVAGGQIGHPPEVLRDAGLHGGTDRRDVRRPSRPRDAARPRRRRRVRDLDAVMPRPRPVDEPCDAVDLERGIGRIAREDVGRDERVPFHHGIVAAASRARGGRAPSPRAGRRT